MSPYPTRLATHYNPRLSTCGSSALGVMQYTVGIAAGQFFKHTILWSTSMKFEKEMGKERPT